jgi:hypothetical protein
MIARLCGHAARSVTNYSYSVALDCATQHRRRDLEIFREADRLAKSLEAARSQPMPDPIRSMDAEAMIREIRHGREAR